MTMQDLSLNDTKTTKLFVFILIYIGKGFTFRITLLKREGIFMKKSLIILLVLTICLSTVMAETYLNANDLTPCKLTSTFTTDGVAILATAEKAVDIEALEIVRESEDGEVFNGRIKLNGTGSTSYRAIKFNAKKGETLTVYANSSSKTEARTLTLANESGPISSLVAKEDVDNKASIAKVKINTTGTYYLYSKNKGINIYTLIVE